MVLLDFLVQFFRNKNGQKWLEENLIVAHFEHGIRGKESQEDCEFVRRLAEKDRLKFEFEHGNLGENSSEERARNARYIFLRKIAKRENAIIFTAHHKNDLAETFALNLARFDTKFAPNLFRAGFKSLAHTIKIKAKFGEINFTKFAQNIDFKKPFG